MLKKIIFGVIVVLAVAAGIYWFTYTKETNTPVSSAINAIPSNASFIFESKNALKIWDKISQTNVIWEELLNTQTFSQINTNGRYIDSLIKSSNAVSQLMSMGSVFVSAHVSGANSFDFLYVYSLPNANNKGTFENFIKSANKAQTTFNRDYDGVNIATIYPTRNDSLSFSFFKGIVLVSTKQNLIEASIRQLKSGISIANDKNLSKVFASAGKNVDANIYVNYKNLPTILHHFANPVLKKECNTLSYFADCSEWDVHLKPNALMLNGLTQANDSSINFLNIFTKQKTAEIEVTKVIPAKTAFFMFWGISNTKLFQHDYQRYLVAQKHSTSYKNTIENINDKYKIDIEQAMLSWIDHEIVFVITEPSAIDYTNNSYAVFHSTNVREAYNNLCSLTDTINRKNKQKAESITFEEHAIHQLRLPGIVPLLLGSQFDKITGNYFTAIDDYIVFANTQESLQRYITDVVKKKTLANDKNYQSFTENLSGEANLYMYSSLARSGNIYKTFVTEQLAQNIEDKMDVLNKFQAIGVQFSYNNNLFYSDAYLKYNPQYKQESGTIWESKLDTTVSSKPYIVINHTTQAKEILVQDDANKLYLISNTGKILWTKQLSEKIKSDVVQVDVLNNKKLQFLFNTEKAIYVLDRNGKDLRNFPVKLNAKATNSVSVFDYEQNHDYRIFVACADNKILCYKTNGQQVGNFKMEKTASTVRLPIQYFIIKEKEYLCAVDEKGKAYVFNRRGETAVKMNETLAKNAKNIFIETGKDEKGTFLVTADSSGLITQINLTGGKDKIKVQNFEGATEFEYKDIDNDNVKEYIFLNNNELKVFSRDKSLLFKYEFEQEVLPMIQFFIFPDKKGKIGIVSKSGNELFLINHNGSLYKGFPLAGKTAFSITDLNNEAIYNVISGSSDNSIYVYQLQ